ncbi:MAG: hypothetical protein ABEK17_00790 [Candidatus Aenigmatarchaeota archaeon]
MEKVVICGSGSFHKEAKEWKDKLEGDKYEVIKYPNMVDIDSIDDYKEAHKEHYEKINECNILFIMNLDKNNIENYIGPSVFVEIAYAIGLNITKNYNIDIFLLNSIPEEVPYSEELNLWKELGWIKRWHNRK